MAAEHLLERGFTHFGFIGHPGIGLVGRTAATDFAKAVAAAGHSCDEYRGAGKTLRRYHQRSWEKEMDDVAAWVRTLPEAGRHHGLQRFPRRAVARRLPAGGRGRARRGGRHRRRRRGAWPARCATRRCRASCRTPCTSATRRRRCSTRLMRGRKPHAPRTARSAVGHRRPPQHRHHGDHRPVGRRGHAIHPPARLRRHQRRRSCCAV